MLQALRNFIPLVLIDLGDGLLPDLVEQIDQAIPDLIFFLLATKLGGAQQQELHTQLATIGNMGQRTASGRFFEPRTRVFLKRLGEREVPLPCPGRSDDLLPSPSARHGRGMPRTAGRHARWPARGRPRTGRPRTDSPRSG